MMKKFIRSIHPKWLSLFLLHLTGIMILACIPAQATNGVKVFTPYTKISVPPGESISYNVDLINNGTEMQNAEISVTGVPHGWNYSIKSGIYNLGQLAVLPGEKRSFTLNVDVPLKVNKGTYRFNIVAKGFDTLPLTVVVSEQGTFKTEFTTNQPNMEGPSNSTFTFEAELMNRTADNQLYTLSPYAPRGWTITIKADYKQVSSVNVDANATKKITIDIKPPDGTKAGSYKIPITAQTTATSASVELEVVITGSYSLELTTPTGLLSSDITAGDEKKLSLIVKNTGSAELKDINLSYNAPINWEVTFDPKIINKLGSGEQSQVNATVKAAKNAIAGDYAARFEAKTPEANGNAEFRISVKTPLIWGWVGIMVILVALGSVYYLFRKYGRR